LSIDQKFCDALFLAAARYISLKIQTLCPKSLINFIVQSQAIKQIWQEKYHIWKS